MTTSAVILAAGCGSRLGAGASKAFVPIGTQPMICYCVKAFSRLSEIDDLVVVVRKEDMDRMRQVLQPAADQLRLVEGGKTRRDSALAGVRAAKGDLVLVHDGARPFPSPSLIRRVLAAAQRDGAAIPVLPITDLLHRADGAGHINGEADVSAHALLVRAQTPQGFKRTLLLESLEAAPPGVRDDATAVLQSGGGVATVPGEETNIKITYPSDLSLAEAIAAHL